MGRGDCRNYYKGHMDKIRGMVGVGEGGGFSQGGEREGEKRHTTVIEYQLKRKEREKKLKGFYMAKETITKMKRELSIRENIFANDTLDKGLISKIYKNLYDSTPGGQTIQLKNGQRTWTDTSKEDIQRAHRHI